LRDRADVALDGSKISFRLRRGYARKSIKGEKLPTQNPEDPYFETIRKNALGKTRHGPAPAEESWEYSIAMRRSAQNLTC